MRELPKGLKHLCDQGEDYIWRPAKAAAELIEKLQSENAELRKERDEVINYLKLIECEPINSEYFAGQALDMLGVK